MSILTCCLPGPAAENRKAAEELDNGASPGQESQFFKQGLDAQDNAEWKQAIGFFEKAVESDGKNANYLYHLAYCLQEVAPDAGDDEVKYHKRAMENYKKVLTLEPNNHEAWYNLGYVQEELEEFDEAIKSFNQAIKIEPTDKDAHINLGNCYMSRNEFEESVKTYHAAIALDPNCVMSHYNLASAHHSAASTTSVPSKAKNHYKLARGEFYEAIRLNPNYADAYFNLGICYQDENDVEKARKMYSEAIKLQPDMREATDALEALR
jgi:tetratricopeptide (TPR) repeat protein